MWPAVVAGVGLHVARGGCGVAEEDSLLKDREGEHRASRAEEGVRLGANQRVDDGEVRLYVTVCNGM